MHFFYFYALWVTIQFLFKAPGWVAEGMTPAGAFGEWAFAYVTPKRPGGGEIFYVYTRYQAAVDEGMFDDQVYALLRETPAGWLVYEYRLGATDVPWLEWGRLYPVPWEVFPGR